MRKRNLVLLVISSVVFFFCGLTVSTALAKSFIANTFFPDKHPLAKYGYVNWAKDLEKASGGKLKVQLFTGTVLLPPRSGLSGVRDGIAQVGHHAAVYTPSELPVSNAIQELGFSYSDPLVAIAAITEFNMTDAEMLAQWKKVGVIYAGGYCTPAYCIMCSKPVRNLEELKGKKLRTCGAANSRWVQSTGAVPVNLPSSEMYTGLEKGNLDCATNVVSDLKSRSLWDVAKHTTLVPLGMYWSGPQWAVNPDFWKDLSVEERHIFFDVTAQAIANLYVGYQAAVQEAIDESESHGVNIYEPSEDMLASIHTFTQGNYPEVLKMAREKYKIKDPEALFDRFRKVVDKWDRLFANVDHKDAAAIGKLIKQEIYDKIDVASFGN